jgi:TetR/AcrR family transcriptional regulator
MSEIKKDNTEDKILEAAQTIFTHKGMDGARMQEIANEAGINKALLHYYFRTKQKLFEAIFNKVFKQIFPNLQAFIDSELPIDEKLGTFIDKYISLLLRNPFLPSFILKEIHRDPEFLASVIKSTGVNPNAVFSMFEKEMKAGKIRKMNPKDLLINILALSVFPVAAKPLMQIMFFENDKKAYNDFLAKRNETVKVFILNSILVEKKLNGSLES